MTVSAHRAHPREPVFQRESGKPMSRGATPRGVKRPWGGGTQALGGVERPGGRALRGGA